MNDDNKRFSFKKLIARIGSLFMTVATLLLSCGNNALVAHAAEVSYDKGNTVSFNTVMEFENEDGYQIKSIQTGTMTASSDWEIVGCVTPMLSGDEIVRYDITFTQIESASEIYGLQKSGLSSVTGSNISYRNGEQSYFSDYSLNFIPSPLHYSGVIGGKYKVSCSITGCKVFLNSDALEAYAATGDTSGMIEIGEPELNKDWYLKNVQYKVAADDSPTSEAGEDATYIHFTWDTDNLQEGDLLEIKTYNYYSKIGGEKLSGFYDYITEADLVSACSGAYSFSQYDATKAWFNSLENKPLVFKEYETTDYYLRPYRQGQQYGGWVHIKMGRATPTSSPYVEDVEYGDFDDDNNWTPDEDLTNENGGHHGIDQGGSYIPSEDVDNPFTGTNIAGIFSYFYDFMKSIPSMLADLPALVSSIISFLPAPIIGFIGIAIVVVIILRIVGR